MAEKEGAKQVTQYIRGFEGKAQEYLSELRKLILEIVPEAEELMNYGIPAFALISGGKREQQLMMAGYKKHIGFYPHPTTMEHFWEDLNDYKKAKGSVQFQLNEPLPKDLIRAMVAYRGDLIQKELSNK